MCWERDHFLCFFSENTSCPTNLILLRGHGGLMTNLIGINLFWDVENICEMVHSNKLTPTHKNTQAGTYACINKLTLWFFPVGTLLAERVTVVSAEHWEHCSSMISWSFEKFSSMKYFPSMTLVCKYDKLLICYTDNKN